MKKLKNIKSTITLSVIALLSFTTSCRKDMNGLNQDLKLLPQPLLSIDGKEASILLPGMMTNIESPVNYIYQGQQDLGQDEYAGYTTTPSVFLGNVNNFTYSFVSDWVDYCWDVPQQNILNTWLQWKLKKFDTKYPDLYGIALICKVFGASRAADTFGPIPYSKIGTTADVPFDTVQEAYNAFFADLDQAIVLLSAVEDKEPDADQLRFKPFDNSKFGGDYAKWIRTANTLKLRLAIRISNINPIKSKTEAESAVSNKYGVLEAADGGFFMNVSGENPIDEIVTSWGDMRLGAPVGSILGGLKDPRLAKMALPADDPALNGQVEGIRTGIQLTTGTYSNFSKLATSFGAPLKIMSVAESFFLRSEGVLRGWNMGGGSAQSFYEDGVKASFNEYGAGGVDAYLADATSTPAAYVDPKNAANNAPPLSNITVKWNDGEPMARKLERIITQKWIAIYPEGYEGWAEFRRTGYPQQYPITKNDSQGKVANGDFVKRMPYSATFTNASKAQVDAAVAKEFGGDDSPGKRLWWDVN
ncbi:SusD/RagB family nutrient-binding outer membrane lipoprotein [Mucilaginibacter sp. OK098]|uniref:SusD/RagB family nutrient-binding outer membrane lipoprotein n=1 Tax=Mucilaginibacter sp. OK098 TaxID=1855297 RepID=UPI000921E193|nr:SusD/RagB family nutrient-binding outer membrane lipoprotein [Mucilaginibacter sp. OK098]SHN36860.1 Susd and RagB outer membrane lipoprotein [Mucilaginibacter sp. OK098]